MQIAWKYLNKRAATISALEDLCVMQSVLENTPQDIIDEHEKLEVMRSPIITGMPRSHNPQAGEDSMVNGLDRIDILTERYLQAKEYMDWFVPAWELLSKDEQDILNRFYLENNTVDQICESLDIERSNAYRKKDRALYLLATLLYGINE